MLNKTQLQALYKELAAIKSKSMELAGYSDCKQGMTHSAGYGINYDLGYNTRYQEEQIAGAKS
jgi:hypothetical protein